MMTLLGRIRLRCFARVVFPEHVAPLEVVKKDSELQCANQPDSDEDDSSFLGHLASLVAIKLGLDSSSFVDVVKQRRATSTYAFL
jgi:hypothetical protein